MDEKILNQLKDVHLPKDPSWWPLASGYYIVFFAIIFLFIIIYILIKKQKPRFILRKHIKKELSEIEKNYNLNNNSNLLQSNLVGLIRRICRKNKLDNNNLKICVENLWGKNQDTEEFLALLEHDRFKKISTIDSSRLLSLAQKKFKTCKL